MFVKRTSLLIETKTGRYPTTVADIQKNDSRYIFGELIDDQLLQELGYSVVEPVTMPTDGQYREDKPVSVKGKYKQVWVKVVKSQADLDQEFQSLKSQRRSELDRELQENLSLGYAHDFGTKDTPNVKHVQVRDSDIPKLLMLKDMASVVNSDKVLALRTQENENMFVKAPDVVVVVNAAIEYHVDTMSAHWKKCQELDKVTRLSGLEPPVASKPATKSK